MTRGKQAHGRVNRILNSTRPISAGLRKPAWALVALLAAPVIYVLAGARPVVAHRLLAEGAQAAAVSIHPLADLEQTGSQAPPAGPATPASPTSTAAPKAPPSSTTPPKAPSPPPEATGKWTYAGSDEAVMIVYEKSMSGSGTFRDGDADHLNALRRASNGDIVWFRREGKEYIIRDPETVQQAKAILDAPGTLLHEELEEAKRELELHQNPLAARQEEPHQQWEQVRVPVPDLTAELKKLQAQLEQLHKSGASPEELGKLQDSLKDLNGKVSELQGKAVVARKQAFDVQQYNLGEQRAREEKEIQRKLNALFDDALAKGLAQPE